MQSKNTELVNKIQKVRKCKRSSARTYASTIVRVGNEFAKGGFNKDLKWVHQNSIYDKLKKSDKGLNVLRNLVNSMLIALSLFPDKGLSDKYNEYLKDLNKKVDEVSKSGVMSEKQASQFLSWEKIIKLRRLLARKVRLCQCYNQKKLSSRDFKLITSHLVLCLYTMLPPVRLSWSSVTFHSEKGFANIGHHEGNHLVMRKPNWIVVWQDYKTAGKYGKQTVDIPKPLERILRTHIRYLKRNFPNNSYLLLNSRYEPMSRVSLSKFLQSLFYSYFKKKISTTAIRRSFLSHKYSFEKKKEEEEVARQMLQSTSVQKSHYIKKT